MCLQRSAGRSRDAPDQADRLTSWTGPGSGGSAVNYVYDNNGNRTSAGGVTSTFDQRNRQLTDGTTTMTWTPRGTLATTNKGTTTNYTFDGLGRMTAAGAVTYSYDALDRIAQRNGAAFLYSGLGRQPSDDTTTRVARTPAGDPATLLTGGTALAIGQDRHGDIVATINPATGALADTVSYDPYGVLLARNGTNALLGGFQGDYTDPPPPSSTWEQGGLGCRLLDS